MTDVREGIVLDKEVLIQYCEMKEEIKDLRKRIQKLDKFLENPPIHCEGNPEGRDDRTDQDHGNPGTGVFPQAGNQGEIQEDVGIKGGGAAGAYLSGGGVHTGDRKGRAADYVQVVLY